MSRQGDLEPTAARCAFVTGASRGIGAAIALRLAADGWPVGVNYSRDREGAAQVVERILADGGQAIAIEADVADTDDVERAFEVLEASYGPVLVLVNNAGVRCDRLLGTLKPDDWSRVLAVNLGGPFHTMRRAVGAMLRSRFGRIVNVTSVAADRSLPGQSAYAASKAGLEGLTRTAAIEVARRGITVNAVAPGMVQTDFLPDAAQVVGATFVPTLRLGDSADVADCVRFLISPEASYITGAVIPIDGGVGARLLSPVKSPQALPAGQAIRKENNDYRR